MAAILGNGRQIAHLGPLFGLARLQRPHRLIGFDRGRRRPDQQRIVAGVDDQFIAVIHVGKQLIDAAKHGHAHGAGHDDDVRRQAAFFQHHALQVALVIFQQFGRAEIAGNQYGIAGDAQLRCRAQLAGKGAQQPVGEIIEIGEPFLEIRIVD